MGCSRCPTVEATDVAFASPYRVPSPPPSEPAPRFYCWPDVAYLVAIVALALVVSFGVPLLMRRLTG
jgi:hypothetical protein